MNRTINFFLPLIIVACCAGIAFLMFANKPEQKRHKPQPATLSVEAIKLKKQDYQIVLHSRGTVKPRVESTLISEVTGRIVSVSQNFREGGFFDTGEVLLKIDKRNYVTAAKIAESELISARLSLEQEKVRVTNFDTEIVNAESRLEQAKLELAEERARGHQAKFDWERINPELRADDLALRKPQFAAAVASAAAAVASLEQTKRNADLRVHQIAAAEALVEAAEARLEEKRLDLERTSIMAPYAGILLTQDVDIGQYVVPSTILSRLYAVDYVEIRLPLSNRQLEFIDLPGQYRQGISQKPEYNPSVTLKSRYGRKVYLWKGKIVRTQGAYDTQSRELFVVAKVENPYGKADDDKPSLKVGQFVEAEIEGNMVEGVFVLPAHAVREGNEVLIINKDKTLSRRTIKPLWSDEQNIIVSEGLEMGELLCTTPLNFAVNGVLVQVSIEGEKSEQ